MCTQTMSTFILFPFHLSLEKAGPKLRASHLFKEALSSLRNAIITVPGLTLPMVQGAATASSRHSHSLQEQSVLVGHDC